MSRTLLIICLLTASLFSQASDVLIKTPHATGQGFFFQKNNECYVVTPAHVIGPDSNAQLFTADRKRHTAIKHHVFDIDMALLQVTSSPSPCKKSHPPVNKLSTVLTVVKNGELRTKLDDSSTLRTPIDIIAIDETEFLQIKASDTNRPFKQGFSGSVLYIANSISGVLLEVDDGYGYVYRYDALEKLLNNYFGINNQKPVNTALQPQHLAGTLNKGETTKFNIELHENSPIEIASKKFGAYIKYQLEIFDAEGERRFSDEIWTSDSYRKGFTPLTSGPHTVSLTGLSRHGKYDIDISQYSLDSTLRGAGNVFVPGETLQGKLAVNSIAEYRFEAQANSPVEIASKKFGAYIKYQLEIFDAEGERRFSDGIWTSNSYRKGFTPLTTGPHTVRLTGLSRHGKYDINISQYSLDSTLRGAGNVFVPGETLLGKLAVNSIAEYRFEAQANSPVEIASKKFGAYINYRLEIFDADGERRFSDGVWTSDSYRKGFTPQTSGTHTIRLTGLSRHGKYQLEVK